MRLYHFTCLKHLPAILQDGITQGEVPTGPEPDPTKRPNAPNLTLVGDRQPQQDWNRGNVWDKTRVRLVVELPGEELTSFAEVVRIYDISQSWVERIDPLHQRDKWFFAFGGVAVEQIKEVQVFDEPRAEYVPVSGNDLADLIQRINVETKTLRLVRFPNGTMGVFIKDGDTSWLLDGPALKREREAKRRHAARRQAELNRRRENDRKRKLQRKQKAKQRRRCSC